MGEAGSAREVEAVARIDAVPTILDVVCRATGMGFAAIARVTEDRWIACAVRDDIQFGLQPGGELDVKTTICDEIRVSTTAVIIDDVASDPRYCGHPTAGMYGFRSYISMPIFRADKSFFGTLCAIDPKPAKVSRPEIVGMFRLFADLIGFHLDAEDRLAASGEVIAQHQHTDRLREQFIAVLGHDLRNPLASIDAGMNLLQRTALDDKSKTTVALVRQTVRRMSELIENILDFARGRLGGGLTINPTTDKPLAPVLEQVVSEMRAAAVDRKISAQIELAAPVRCDPSRIGQMLSNFMANALAHGKEGGTIRVEVRSDPKLFTLSVANDGDPVQPEVAEGLFQPYSQIIGGERREGLGLGLYICAEIARAHGGKIDLKSDGAETRFTFVMPQAG